jgi:carbon dioxide concentrating mechanism protein CcmL
MQVGKVVGSLVSTQKHESLKGMKLMIVQIVDENKEPVGNVEIAVDTISSGVGEYVLLTRGSSARHIFETDIGTAVDCAIVGIVDSFER